jgi:hypothetical protein
MKREVASLLIAASLLSVALSGSAHDDRPVSDIRVYVHYRNASDRPLVDGVANMLASLDYRVMDKRLVSQASSGDVRFFFALDRTAAVHVQSVVENFLLSHGWPVRLALLDRCGRFENARPGLVEVWIPTPPPDVDY